MTSEKNHIPLLLLLLSFVLRLALISKGPYHADCLSLTVNAEHFLATGQLLPLFGSGYPLTVLGSALFVGLGQLAGISDPVTAVNLFSAFCGALSVLMLYLVAARLFNPMAALLSGLWWATAPTFLALSTYGNSHTLSIFLLLAGVFFLLKSHQPQRQGNGIIAAVCLGLTGAARLQDLILMLPALSIAFLSRQENKPAIWSNFRRLIGLGIITAGIVVLFHLPFIVGEYRGSYLSQFTRFYQAGVTKNFEGLVSESLLYSGQEILFNLSFIGAFFSLSGLALLLRRQKKTLLFLLLWLAGPLAFYGNLTTTVPRFLVLSQIPLILAGGYLAAELLRRTIPRWQAGIIFSFSLMLMILLHNIHPILSFRRDHALLPDFGRFVGQMTPANAVIVTSDEGLFIDRYGHRQTIRRPRALDAFSPSELTAFRDQLDTLLAGNTPLFITGTGLYSYDPSGEFQTLMNTRYRLTLLGSRLCEDWHQGENKLRLGQERLFKIDQR